MANQRESAGSPGWTKTLGKDVAALVALHEPMERAFLGIGTRLRDAQGNVRKMAELATGTVSLLSGERMSETLGLLDDAVRSVQELRLAEDEGGSDLGRIAAVAEVVAKPLTTLGALMSEVDMLGVNAKIEAAHIDRTTSEFTVFTHEIARLAARGRAMLERLLGGLADLRAAAATAIAHHDDFRATHMREFEAVASRLETSTQALKMRQAKGAGALDRLPGEVAGVANEIASLVFALQGSDITRQRLEHVEAALLDLAATVTKQDHAAEMEREQVHLFADAVCELESCHLDDMKQEFAGKLAGIDRSLASLRRVAVQLGSEAETVYASDDRRHDFLADIGNDLAAVGAMLDRYADAMDNTDRSLKTVVDAANAMAESMEAISKIDTDMNLLGLNASIRCGNLGSKGRSLNVVAQELRAYARRTQGLANGIAGSIDEVHAVVEHLSGSARRADSGRLREVGTEIREARERLAGLGRETALVLAAIAEPRREVGRELDEAHRLLGSVGVFQRTIAEVVRDLQTVRAEVKPALSGPQLAAARKELLSFLSSRYTMASERELHTFLLDGRVAVKPAAEPAPQAAADDIADLLF